MGLLYTFIIASLLLVTLVVIKSQELKTGNQSFLGRFLVKGDPFFSKLIFRIQHLFHHHREQTFFLFLVHIPSRIEALIRSIRVRMHDYYHGTSEKMRNKQNLSQNTVSPYMRSMSLNRDGEGF